MTELSCQQKSFGKNPEKQQAREVAWGIGTFCIQGLDAIGSPGKKIPAPAVFPDCAAKAQCGKEAFLLT